MGRRAQGTGNRVVSAGDSRDRSLDHLLRQASSPSSVSDQCVDGETLAAWVEGSLPTSTTTTVERHLADCARCQALLAAFVRSEPPISAGPARATPWWHLRWIVPFATAATAVAVWVFVPTPAEQRQELPVVADQKVGAAESYVSPSNMTAQSSPPALTDAELPVLPAPAPARRGQANEAGGRAARESDRLAEKTSPESARKAKEEADLRADVSERVRVGSAEATSKQPAAPPSLAMAQQERENTTVEFISPDTTMRWRIVGGSRVDRSIDSGISWYTALTSTHLVAGHSPSPSVAWLVGRGGSVFVTTYGPGSTRCRFPRRPTWCLSSQSTTARRRSQPRTDAGSRRPIAGRRGKGADDCSRQLQVTSCQFKGVRPLNWQLITGN